MVLVTHGRRQLQSVLTWLNASRMAAVPATRVTWLNGAATLEAHMKPMAPYASNDSTSLCAMHSNPGCGHTDGQIIKASLSWVLRTTRKWTVNSNCTRKQSYYTASQTQY